MPGQESVPPLAGLMAPEIRQAYAGTNHAVDPRGAPAYRRDPSGKRTLRESIRNILLFAGITVTLGLTAVVAVLVASRVVAL